MSFYTPPHDSGPLCLSVRPLVVRLSIHPFRMITGVNINGFSSNLVCTLILGRSGLRLLMGKFRQILAELSARDMLKFGDIFGFPNDNFSKCQGILTKRYMH